MGINRRIEMGKIGIFAAALILTGVGASTVAAAPRVDE
jgi:hypothetical protein